MRHAPYTQRPIIKSNIELLKLFITRFKGHFVLFKRLILDQIAFDANHPAAKLTRLTGLMIVGSLLSNSYPLYDPVNDKEVRGFLILAAHAYYGVNFFAFC